MRCCAKSYFYIANNFLAKTQRIVGVCISELLRSTKKIDMSFQEAKDFVLSCEDMASFVAVHDQDKEQFSQWWAYEPKRDLVLGDSLGGWKIFQKRRTERLGQKSTECVSFCCKLSVEGDRSLSAFHLILYN